VVEVFTDESKEEVHNDEAVVLSKFSPSQEIFLRRSGEKLSSMLLQWKKNRTERAERP
jgi:hypothetical protein